MLNLCLLVIIMCLYKMHISLCSFLFTKAIPYILLQSWITVSEEEQNVFTRRKHKKHDLLFLLFSDTKNSY